MKRLALLISLVIVISVFSHSSPASTNKPSAVLNRIEGSVYDPNRNPVSDIDVELLNELGSFLNHTKTNSAGRFSFIGTSIGHFKVRVLPFRLNLSEQIQDVEIDTLGRGGSNIVYVDFYLRYDKRGSKAKDRNTPEAIFVQEIPREAEELYQDGLRDLDKNPDKALSKLEKAIKIFPNYFDALYTLGKKYIDRQEFRKGYPYLLRAIDVNSRSSSAFYTLAYAFVQLNESAAAVKAANAAVIISPSSVDSQLIYGVALRLNENYIEAEKTLLKAKSLTKKPVSEIHWQLALVYNRLNRNKDAVKELELYLKAEPKSPDKKKIEDLIAKLQNSQ